MQFTEITKELGIVNTNLPAMPDVDKIELTEEEKEKVLREALRLKRAAENTRVYNLRVVATEMMPTLSANDIFRIATTRAKKTIPGFVLNDEQEKLYKLLSKYFSGDRSFTDEGDNFRLEKGIMLFGGVGCGKTTMMRMFMYNPVASYVMKSCRMIASEYKEDGEVVLHRYAHAYHPEGLMMENPFKVGHWGLCFDDLGTEDIKKHFGNQANVMQQILLNRYDRSNELANKTHTTTNLNHTGLTEYYGERVASRIREMFNIITVKGTDMRK